MQFEYNSYNVSISTNPSIECVMCLLVINAHGKYKSIQLKIKETMTA